MRIAFVGAGKVGTTLARAWHSAGWTVSAIYSRNPAHATGLAQRVMAQAAPTLTAIATNSDLLCLTVPDDAIAGVCEQLAALDAVAWQHKTVIHMSGAHSVEVLGALTTRGAQVASLHPALPFAHVDKALLALEGAGFAVEAPHEATQAQLFALVNSVGGVPFVVPSDAKAAYHAALVIASNYTVTLYHLAEQILATLGVSPAVGRVALNPIVSATVENLVSQGTPHALTGPLVRGDVGTLSAHLGVLANLNPDWNTLYKQLAQQTYPMLTARGVDLEPIQQLLSQDDTRNGTQNDSSHSSHEG